MNPDWTASYDALRSVYADEAYSNIAVNQAISHHSGCRDSLVRVLVKETLSSTTALDMIIDRLASGGLRSIRLRTLIILRMGLCALRSMDSIPDHAAVNEAVDLARRKARGTDRFVNAVLRSYLRERDKIEEELTESRGPAFRYAFPEGVISLLSEQYGEETESILEGLNSRPPLVLRVNSLRTSRDELAEILAGDGIKTTPAEGTGLALIASGTGIPDTDAYRRGLFTVQSLSSIMAVSALNPAPGSRVLDMCAAPGGKTCMMAELMGNTGSITACDIHDHRLELIRKTAERMGDTVITTRLMDGTKHDSSLDNSYDYVLADVPCSGLGVIGSKPEIKFRTDPGTYEELTRVQMAILENAARYVRPGGYIEYSTCTINKNENERLIAEALKHLSFLSLVEMRTYLPYNVMVGFYYCILRKNANQA